MPEVNFDDLDADANQCYLYGNQPFTGVARDRLPSGAVVVETQFVDGAKQGASTEWFPTGQVRQVCNYMLNMPHGKLIEYDSDGNTVLEAEFEYGVCLWRRRYAPGGAMIEEYSIQSSPTALEALAMARRTFVPRIVQQTGKPSNSGSG